MLTEPIKEKLYAMKLTAMVEAWMSQQKAGMNNELSFDERFGMIVDAEFQSRDNRRLNRLLKNAQLRLPSASLEDFSSAAARGVEKGSVRQLASCSWIVERLNVLVSGPTGVGKSYLACALGQAACRRGFSVLYRRLPRLFEELGLAKADGTYPKLLAKFAKFDLLILDDLGHGSLQEGQRYDLLEIIEDRYDRTSTVVTSQLPVSKWHDWLGDPTTADAILDRIVHNAYKFNLKGQSKRKEKTQA